MADRFDCIVIGVGGMGSSAVHNLASRGQKVLGLEKFDIPHTEGSSHGVNRIIRLAYYEDPSYVPLLRRAYEMWNDIESEAGEQLLYKVGSIDTAPSGHEVFEGSLKSCLEHDIPHEVLDHQQINNRFPGYQMPPGQMGLYQKDGGFVLSERAIIAYVNAAVAAGAEIHARESVVKWETEGDGVRVFTDRAEYTADRLVITAGAWAAGMVPSLEELAVPERQVLAWLQPEEPALFAPENFPVFNAFFEEGRYYGFPVFGIPGFKIGRYHHLEEVIDPDHVEREVTQEDEDILRAAAARYFPKSNGTLMTLKTCMFTNTPDEHFIIDVVPGTPQVSVAAGFSGHGFKFASVVGEILGDLAIDGETIHNIDLLNINRF
ncbi:MAG: N-methyl-L-tryptophan oxidase [Chloroflexi bacterium]|nr:N-methyl-L-tryptophan oxidase [Chloroflexota bacterium]MBT5628089.1 N-methyl-L-tryptophan oxidase [Chloroflexota bacterium]